MSSRVRTWAGLLRVDVGTHSLWDFLVSLMEGLGAELITPSSYPRQEEKKFQVVERKNLLILWHV
jgi:hypothetical protein